VGLGQPQAFGRHIRGHHLEAVMLKQGVEQPQRCQIIVDD
jgi:hypothetical protein